ncbi:MAG TPA: BBE domain-containing protein [Acidimicrobiales bacterium]|nr:BBE domain-containing protein [Acidimicrobiales bacterium]
MSPRTSQGWTKHARMRVREAYGDANYRRLAEVKAKYDPENAFRNNKNIPPATPAH